MFEKSQLAGIIRRYGSDMAPQPKYGRHNLSPNKGKLNGECNVTACQAENQARHYNTAMRAYYCYRCAMDIEASANSGGMSLFEGGRAAIKQREIDYHTKEEEE